jgi:hypothetical protein
MADSVTVDHGGVTITTNTASEADLRAEMEAPAAPPEAAPESAPAEAAPPADAAAPVRDEKGRFVPRKAAEPAAPEPEAAPAPEAVEKAPRDPSLPRHNPIARMQQALAQKAEAERRAAALEVELIRARQAAGIAGVPAPVTPPASGAPPPAAPTGEPQFEQFAQEADPYTAYLQAWTRWDHARQLEERFARYDAERTARAQQATFETRLQEGRAQYPDWDEALTQADTLGLQVSEVMRAAITTSPRAADLVHYLATHPEECLQLAEESVETPVAAATVMRRLLESQVSPRAVATNGAGSAARPVVSQAKPPVKPVGSSPVVSDAPPGDEASAAEHARYWNRKLKVPGTR